jgi:hypothetical protein
VDGGFAPTFKEAVGRWRRRHRHPPANETWFAVHYRVGWLVERLSTLESIHLLRQGLDVRPLAAERPARRRKEGKAMVADDQAGPDLGGSDERAATALAEAADESGEAEAEEDAAGDEGG